MTDHAITNAQGWLETVCELVSRLDGNDKTDQEAAREEIQEGPLSVMVRDGWRQPGSPHNDEFPEEYEILLTTGGPALRIYGKLNKHCEPDEWPELQYQDWGTLWTSLPIGEERDALVTYACQFYFGD